MARFLTDADIPVRLGVLVGSGGHDVLRAYHAGVAHAGDDEALVTAARLGRILITHNAGHFALLHSAWLRWPAAWGLPAPPQHPGILTLPQMPAIDYPQVVQAIDQLVTRRPLLINELHAWRGTHWEQR